MRILIFSSRIWAGSAQYAGRVRELCARLRCQTLQNGDCHKAHASCVHICFLSHGFLDTKQVPTKRVTVALSRKAEPSSLSCVTADGISQENKTNQEDKKTGVCVPDCPIVSPQVLADGLLTKMAGPCCGSSVVSAPGDGAKRDASQSGGRAASPTSRVCCEDEVGRSEALGVTAFSHTVFGQVFNKRVLKRKKLIPLAHSGPHCCAQAVVEKLQTCGKRLKRKAKFRRKGRAVSRRQRGLLRTGIVSFVPDSEGESSTTPQRRATVTMVP